jgi:hypothetical protein
VPANAFCHEETFADQCRKCRQPVKIMAMPCSSRTLMVSASRLDAGVRLHTDEDHFPNSQR